MDKLYIVMPAYNEEANIETVIREWYPIIEAKSEDSRLVIIDDGSKGHFSPMAVSDVTRLQIELMNHELLWSSFNQLK